MFVGRKPQHQRCHCRSGEGNRGPKFTFISHLIYCAESADICIFAPVDESEVELRIVDIRTNYHLFTKLIYI